MERDLRIRVILTAFEKVVAPVKAIQRETKKLQEQISATRREQKAFQDALRKVDGYKAAQHELVDTGAKLAEARERVRALQTALSNTAGPTAALTRDLKRAQTAVGELSEQMRAQGVSLREMDEGLRLAGVDASALEASEDRLRKSLASTNLELKLQQDRLAGLNRQGRAAQGSLRDPKKLKEISNTAMGAGFSATFTGAAASLPFGLAIAEAQEFESVQTDIAQKSEMSRRSAAALGLELRAIAARTNKMPQDIQEAMDSLTGRGMDVAMATQVVEPLARASTTYKATVDDLAKASFAAIDNLQIPATKTGQILDIMAQGGKAGAVELKDMAAGLPDLTAAYQSLGQTGTKSLADLVAALEVAKKGAADPAEAINNIANVLQKIQDPQTRKKFAKVGIDVRAELKKALKDGRSPIETIAELTIKATKGDAGKIGDFFQDRQVRQGLLPLIQHMDEYRKMRAEALGAQGVVEKDFAERMRDSLEASRGLAVSLKDLGLTVGGELNDGVLQLARNLKPMIDRFNAWAKAHPGLVKLAAILAVVLTVVGLLLIAFAGVVGAIALIAANAGVAAAVAGIAAAFTFVAVAAARLWNDLVHLWDAVKKLFSPQQWKAIGQAIMNGLIEGIRGMFPFLSTVVELAAKLLPKAMRDKLGIHSPSRVFAQIGGHAMDGLAVGLQRGQSAPLDALRGAAGSMAAAIALGSAGMAAAAPAAAATAAPSAPYAVHFHAAPGMDERQLFRLFEQWYARQQAGATVARRSGFGDYGD